MRIMQVRICNNKKAWNQWLVDHKYKEFLQSWEWGEFQKETGKKVLRLQVVDQGCVVTQVQGFVHWLGPGMEYVYVPRISYHHSEISNQLLCSFKELGYVFVRLEPVSQILREHVCSKSAAFKFQAPSKKSRQPQHTLILDLTKSEEQLLSQMHSKTRYNIRLAARKGVEILKGKDVDVFWALNEQTTARDGFKSYPKEYYMKMLTIPICHQFTAWHDNTPIASQIYIAFGGRCTYVHGASADSHRNMMAPYLLQWSGIQFAKKCNNVEYDFGGIAPPTVENTYKESAHNTTWASDHTLGGVTRYKAGFGGERWSYPSSVDIIFKPFQYKLYKQAHKLLT
jgi:peptidoglycan pentaglycine glycine transferase (the first glycine)